MIRVTRTVNLVIAASLLSRVGWADDPATLSPAAVKTVRKQIPEPPAELLAKQRLQQARQSAQPARDVPPNILSWDAETKEQPVERGISEAHFVFTATNVSSHDVTLLKAVGSCGCTVAKLPEDPRLVTGASGRIDVTMDLKGKYGKVLKTVTVSTDQGVKVLSVASNLPPPTLREVRQDMATTDRQSVFKGQCANCHVDPTVGKAGEALYATACGVCHESAQRATMVPDLHALRHETGPEFWKAAIIHGKPGTMMPAFAQVEGGILSDAQIDSLVDYLQTVIPGKALATPNIGTARE